MNRKFILRLLLVVTVLFFFNSCRTDEVTQEEKRTERERIEAFSRFESSLPSQKITQKSNSGYVSYHEPFKQIIQSFMSKNPSYTERFHNEVGDIYFNLRSLTYGDTTKGIAYPIIKDGKVNAILIGLVNPQRDWVNFIVVKNDSPEVQAVIAKFQNFYNSPSTTSRKEPEQEEAIQEIIITAYDSIPGPSYVIYQPYMDYGSFGGFGGGMSGGANLYGGTGSGSESPEENSQNPCKNAESSMSDANTILKNSEIKQKMDAVLKGKIQASNEWAVAIGEKSNGDYEVTSAVEQNEDSGAIPTSQLTTSYIGDGHSHSGGRGNPSGGDLYGMINSLAISSPNLKYRFVYGNSDEGTSEVYALVISNATLARQFLNQFPKDQNYDSQNHSFKEDSQLGIEFYKAFVYHQSGTYDNTSGEAYDSKAVAMAYILDKYNAGISVAKADVNGNLKKINTEVTQVTIPYSGVKEGIKISKCP
ncbi:hypothetical protein DRF65_27905 [Chryseobacterium pennae]|uniref:Uncharacterized protein n=2 Tax=Chryseobacterium pennae TaxID=2258962 RepID=A0A3D9C005_9FLAO|nr:hypothetical protein DRF65_27905 [Chryseobacterium pennae]